MFFVDLAFCVQLSLVLLSAWLRSDQFIVSWCLLAVDRPRSLRHTSSLRLLLSRAAGHFDYFHFNDFLVVLFAFGPPVSDTQRLYSPALARVYPCPREISAFSYLEARCVYFYRLLAMKRNGKHTSGIKKFPDTLGIDKQMQIWLIVNREE